MTASQGFWDAISTGRIPAAVPVVGVEGVSGLSTSAVPFAGNTQAEAMVYSDDRKVRATAAVFALHHAHDAARRSVLSLVGGVAGEELAP